MTTQTAAASKMYNEKPSKLANLGQDVSGACRHNFDTHNNTEAKAAREKVKALKDNRKDIKATTIKLLGIEGCDYIAILCAHEMALAAEKMPNFEGNTNASKEAIAEMRAHLVAMPYSKEKMTMVSAFNRMLKAQSRIRWNVRNIEQARQLMAPKEVKSFKEFNGCKRSWALNPNEFSPTSIEALANTTRAVQFGNSLTLEEREYCLQNLNESIKTLSAFYTFDFKSYAFSFGARGRAGSIAHYQDSLKVLAFNRGWSGAFAHELGHAVDYSLGKVSNKMPYQIRNNYRAKLIDAKITSLDMKYYMTPTEIFARLFEQYLKSLIPNISEFMQVTFSEDVMPELDALSHEWMQNVLSGLAVNAQNSEVV